MSLITIINQDKDNKKTVPIGTVIIWYSMLSEYRAKHRKDFERLAQQIELIKL